MPQTQPPDPEVSPDRPKRRYFKAEYKLKVLQEADACGPGGVGELLRREGIYSSHLASWRKQREAGELAGLAPRKRGRKAVERNPLAADFARLQRENQQLQARLQQAELIIDIQKKVSQMLGIPLKGVESTEDA